MKLKVTAGGVAVQGEVVESQHLAGGVARLRCHSGSGYFEVEIDDPAALRAALVPPPAGPAEGQAEAAPAPTPHAPA